MKTCPPKPGFTDITSTKSTVGAISSRADTGVDGLSTTPAFAPSFLICVTVRCRCGSTSTWTDTMLAPASMNASR